MSAQRRLTAKRLYADLSERARLGEVFGFLTCILFLFKSGYLTRDQAQRIVDERGISESDRARFRAHVLQS